MIYQVIKAKKGKRKDMDGSDRIVSMVYIRKDILSVINYCFMTGNSTSKDMEHTKKRIADFGAFKEEARGFEIKCNTIQKSISLWKEYLKTMMENNQ